MLKTYRVFREGLRLAHGAVEQVQDPGCVVCVVIEQESCGCALGDDWRVDHPDLGARAEGRALDLRLDLWNHSPTGFEYGYGGSGPAQLALALLADALGDDERAVRLHQQFKWRYVATRPRWDPWSMTDEQVRLAADEIEHHEALR